MRIPGKGTSKVDPSTRLPNMEEASSLAFSYDNDVSILDDPERLASIWHKIRTSGCELPSLEQMQERGAYVQMAVANAKVSYLAIASEILECLLDRFFFCLGYGGEQWIRCLDGEAAG